LILTDIFGHKFLNNQLIADQFAANGYLTLMPDLFQGDPIPENRPENFDMDSWRKNHTFEHVDPIVEAVIKELKGPLAAEKIGGVGYCFGAKYVTRFLTKKGGLDAGYVAHPSWVTAAEVKGIEGPLSIAAAGKCSHFYSLA
jgi:dienelactone hydrolase